MSEKKVDLAKAELICPMCIGLFRQPRSLQCLHTYCKACLEGLHRSTGRPAAITCPECRTLTTVDTKEGIEGLHLNFRLQNLVKILDVDERKEIVTLSRKSRRTSIVLPCPHHSDKPLECFCEACQVLICIQCIADNHKEHGKISYASDALPIHIKALQDLLPQAEKASRNGETALQEMSTELDAMCSSGAEAVDSVHRYFAKIRDILEAREEMIVESMEKQIKSREVDMTKQRESLQDTVRNLQRCRDTLSTIVLQRSSDINVLLEETSLRNRLQFYIDSVQKTGGEVTLPHKAPTDQFGDEVSFDPAFEILCSQVGTVKPQLPPRHRTVTTRPAHITKPLFVKATAQDSVGTPTINRRTNKFVTPLETKVQDLTPDDKCIPPIPPHQRESSSEIVIPHMEITAKLLTGTVNPTTRLDVFPHGITTRGDATIVVTDIRNSNLRILRSTGKLLELVGKDGSLKFTEPTAVICDYEGNLLVADKAATTSRIVKLSHQGKFLKQYTTKPALKLSPYLGEPMGLAVDQLGQVLVTDMQSERVGVHIFDSQNGKYLKKFEIATVVVMQEPAGIAIDDKGRVVIVDKGNHCFWILSSTGQLLRKIGKQGHNAGELYYPFGVAIDKDGNIFVSESGNHRISMFTAGGKFIKCFGKKGSEPGMFHHPRHLCFDENQRLLVADEMNQRIQIFKL